MGLLCFVLSFSLFADTKFQNQATRVFNKEAAEVEDITVVRDNDHLYVISESQLQVEPQGECCGSIFTWFELPSCWKGFHWSDSAA